MQARLELASTSGKSLPRLVRFCRDYHMCVCESDMIHLMAVQQGSNSSYVLNNLLEEDYMRTRLTGGKRLSAMSDTDMDLFCDGERRHMKENMLMVEEENGTQFNLRLQRVAVQLFYGRRVKADDLLKISQTCLENILNDEVASGHPVVGCDSEDISKLSSPLAVSKRKRAEFEKGTGEDDDSTSDPTQGIIEKGCSSSSSKLAAVDSGDNSDSDSNVAEKYTASRRASFDHVASLVVEEDGATSLKPYTADNQLEYLEDNFQLLSLMIKANAARLQDDMKKEGTQSSRYSSYYGDGAAELKHSKRELVAKQKLHESRMKKRLEHTEKLGLPLPRLEMMAGRFNLDDFEKKIIVLLIGKTVSPLIKALMESLSSSARMPEDVITVGSTLSILCQDFNSQIGHRKYFYQSSSLMKNAIISLSKSRWHVGTGDLTENRVILDRRILDWVVGLDSEINELVEGSDLYEPVVDLAQVVLPSGYMDSLLSQCAAYDSFRQFRVTAGLGKTLGYGNSLVILLCGKSGTGKTMTVNAMAKHLGKKVLLVDFSSLMNKKDGGGNGGDMEVDLKGLFRESKMSNAVLFFDECEVVFKSRNMGADRLLNSLLTEIERHEGIVFMATNRPYEIDEAMHRRITMVLEYREPDNRMRREIWDNLLGINSKVGGALLGSSSSGGDGISSTPAAANGTTSKSSNTGTSTTGNAAVATAADEHDADNALLSLMGKKKGTTASDAAAGVPAVAAKKEAAAVSSTASAAAVAVTATAPPTGSSCRPSLSVAKDVDTALLALKYELTGGFIKNAVLSALLSALSRAEDKSHPIITQEDLIKGCKLQMRGNLTQRNFDDPTPSRRTPLSSLHLSEAHRAAVNKIIRTEMARSTVFGTWNANVLNNTCSPSSSSSSVAQQQRPYSCEQRASISLFAGTAGSGKRTIAKAIAMELGNKSIKCVHAADFLGSNLSEITSMFKTFVQDARLMDAIIFVDGFEHVIDGGGAGGGGGGSGVDKVHVVLTRIMDILYQYHGCVILFCHIENPQNILLQR